MPRPVLRIGAVLSLTGRFARFGNQAANGLRVWSGMVAGAEVDIEDDGGEPSRVVPALEELATRCDLLLGPYSTLLMRSACTFAATSDRLIWNHGGSGDDVQTATPRRVVSVLTPTSRYAESFVHHLAERHGELPLRLAEGRGSFGRQVIAGARTAAHRLGVPLDEGAFDAAGALFAAGSFEEDTALVSRMLAQESRPQVIGTVAAGVQEFARAVANPDGILGVAQWIPGSSTDSRLGVPEADFLSRYGEVFGSVPDYPAAQAVAAAALAAHCAREAGSTSGEDMWEVAARLRDSTFYGEFAIDPVTGAQRGHQMALVRWHEGRMERTDRH